LKNKKIHIIAFDVPYPADYGGVIDIYYRIKALNQLGFKIILHCFDYGRGEQPHLKEITEEINYYSRKKSVLNALNKRPFIVASRKSKELLKRLLEDNEPILFEGIHTTWFLENKEIQKRMTFVRTHNIEHDYYASLAKKATFLKRFYFQREAKKLKKYESILKFSKKILCIREGDLMHFSQYSQNTTILPASLPEIEQKGFKLTEEYALFNGKLSVSENENAAIWLIENIWKKEENLMPLKIAGMNPSKKLIDLAKKNEITLISNPSKKEMDSLLSKARVHILVSDQSTGVKLKLLSALQTSGHVVTNSTIIEGTNLKDVSIVCNTPQEFIERIKTYKNKELDINVFNKRIDFLNENFNTTENCKLFIS
jgi:hypothetical protein